MSSDNFWYIALTDDGKYGCEMRFVSDDGHVADCNAVEDGDPCKCPPLTFRPERTFDTLEDAIAFANSEYTEYGLSINLSPPAPAETEGAKG